MNDLIVLNQFCARCGTELLQSDNFCRHCGLPAAGEGYSVVAAEVIEPSPEWGGVPAGLTGTGRSVEAMRAGGILANRFAVITILLCLGPMGLPALWGSPRFSVGTKILTTAVFVFLTVVVPLGIAWYFLDTAIRPVLDIFYQSRPLGG